jgi:hypothetical protein
MQIGIYVDIKGDKPSYTVFKPSKTDLFYYISRPKFSSFKKYTRVSN